MKRFLIRYPLILSLFALIVTGCIKDNGNDITGNSSSDGESLVKLSLKVPGAAPQPTRALSAFQEEAIYTVDVLVFDNNDKFFDWRYGMLKTDAGEATVEAMLVSSKSDSAGDRFRIVVMANARETLYDLFSASDGTANKPGGAALNGSKGDAYETVMALVAASSPNPTPDTSKGIPMWGELESKVTVSHGKALGNLTLYRALARIDVGTYNGTIPAAGVDTWTALGNFKLEEVRIHNAQNKFRYSPLMPNFSFSNSVNITAPSFAAGASTTTLTCTDMVVAGGVGVGVMRGLYMAEADVVMNGTYGDSHHSDRPCVVVKGYYKPTGATEFRTEPSWYRIDFTIGSNMLHNILRNHNYQVVISAVGGPGHESEAEALKSMNSDLTAVIKTWTPANQAATVVEGQNWLTVSRYDIPLDKWAKTNETVTVTTNAAAGWSASVQTGGGWLTLTGASGGKVTGSSGDEILFNVTDIPGATAEREGSIRITAGKMTMDIIVKQTNTDDDFRLRLSTSQLTFAGRKWDGADWTAPDAQELTVDWAPRANDYEMSLASYTGGGVTGFSPAATSDNATVQVAPDAIDANGSRVAADPFYERSSILTVKSWDALGSPSGASISKQVLIRQVFYNLLVTGTQDYYFQGNSYTWTVRANTRWVAEIAGSDILENITGASGAGSTATAGEKFTFRIKPGAARGSSCTVTFRCPDGNPVLFPPQTFTITAEDEQPNSYLIAPGSTQLIPVRKAYRVWRLDRDLADKYATAFAGVEDAKLVWQDNPNLIQSVSLAGTGESANVVVLPRTGETGNALVAYTIGGEIVWSWHVWVSADAASLHAYASGTLMDRNLGAWAGRPADPATATEAEVLAAHGMFYQPQRKDPIPPTGSYPAGTSSALTLSTMRPLYDDNGTELTASTGDVRSEPAPRGDGLDGKDSPNLSTSIRNPNVFYGGTYGESSWYGAVITPRLDFWHYAEKSDWDPCPEGWRIPYKMHFCSGGAQLTGPTTITNHGFDSDIGYFPVQSYLRGTDGAYYDIAGISAITGNYFTVSEKSGTQTSYFYFRESWIPAYATYSVGMSQTWNVRCVRE